MEKESLTQVFKGIHGKISSHTTAITGIVSTGIVTGINQLVEFAAFKCPCVKDKSYGPNKSLLASFRIITLSNQEYGYLFIFAPAVLLLFLGFAVNSDFWNKVTACCRKVKKDELAYWQQSTCCIRIKLRLRNRYRFVGLFLNALGIASIVPMTWVLLSFIDGDFYACAATSLPYDFSPGQTCETPTVCNY